MSLDEWKALAEAVQALVTTLGLVAAGLWTYLLFVRKRQRFPRAELIQVVSVLDFSPNHRIIHVKATLKNIGDVLIEVILARVNIGQVLPPSPEFTARLQGGEELVLAKESDIRWPKLGRRECNWQEDPCEIEPGEADDFHFDFVIPTSTETVEVYSYFQNEAKRGRNIGWRHTSLVRLESARLSSSNTKGESQHGYEKGTCRT